MIHMNITIFLYICHCHKRISYTLHDCLSWAVRVFHHTGADAIRREQCVVCSKNYLLGERIGYFYHLKV